MGSIIAGIYAFEAGDKLHTQGLYENQGSTVNFTLDGDRCVLSVAAVGAGPKGG